MKWFLAKINYQIICGEGYHTPQFEEQLRLIVADSEWQALQNAKQTGESEQVSFQNEKHQLVRWIFLGVSQLGTFPETINGAELHSRIYEIDCNENHIKLLRSKMSDLVSDAAGRSFREKPAFTLADTVEHCIGKIV